MNFVSILGALILMGAVAACDESLGTDEAPTPTQNDAIKITSQRPANETPPKNFSVAPVLEASTTDFKRAAIEHARYQSCFKSKLSSGYCQISESATDLVAGLSESELEGRIASRLAGLSVANQNTAALIYYEAPDGSLGIYLFDASGLQSATIRPSAQISLAMQGVKRALAVDTRARTVHGDTPAPENVKAVSLSTISELLIPGDMARKIEQNEYSRLLILPSRTASIVPFPALKLSAGRHLVDQAAIVFLPDLDSLTLPINPDFGDRQQHFEALSFDSRKALAGSKVIVGDPDYAEFRGFRPAALPGARQEAVSASRLFEAGETLIGRRATYQAVTNAIHTNERELGLIYFATHGVSDAENPMDGSLLALAEQHLFAREIKSFDFRQSHPLVVLSACQTGLGKQFDGGTFGLLRAWYGAGAGQVVGSLWNVDDAGTRHLMTKFAEQLITGSVSPEEALRLAMLDTREHYSSDPAIWGSFYVFGNPAIN